MSKLLALFVLFEISQLVSCQGFKFLGPGIWSLISVSKCPKEIQLDEVRVSIDVEKRKVNRTHDGLNLKLSLTDELNDNYAIYMEVCKFVDGGCKPYQTLSDESVVRFVKKYSQENMEQMLSMAKLDPPDFPIPKGDYEVIDFVVDYCKMPPKALYGDFEAIIFLIYKAKKVACIKIVVSFNEIEDENDCDK